MIGNVNWIYFSIVYFQKRRFNCQEFKSFVQQSCSIFAFAVTRAPHSFFCYPSYNFEFHRRFKFATGKLVRCDLARTADAYAYTIS